MGQNKWVLVTNLNFAARYESTLSFFKTLVNPISFKWPNNSRSICDGYIFLEFGSFKAALEACTTISNSNYMDKKLNSIVLPDSSLEVTSKEPKPLDFSDYKPIYPLEIFSLSGEPIAIK